MPETGVLCDLLWSDPTPFDAESAPQFNLIAKQWGDNERGVSFIFSEQVVETMVQKYDIELIVRGH